jgi:hypothetical protein
MLTLVRSADVGLHSHDRQAASRTIWSDRDERASEAEIQNQ